MGRWPVRRHLNRSPDAMDDGDRWHVGVVSDLEVRASISAAAAKYGIYSLQYFLALRDGLSALERVSGQNRHEPERR